MQIKTLKRAALVASIVGALMLSAAPSDAATISKTRIAEPYAGQGQLYATVDGKERLIKESVVGAWIIENGNALVYAENTRAEFSQGLLTRYDPNARTEAGQFKLLMDSPVLVENVRAVKGASGKSALLISGTVDGTGGPCVALVDPKRGRVWHHMNARATGVRNGRLVISVYRSEWGLDPKEKPLRILYPTIDELLSRTANPTP